MDAKIMSFDGGAVLVTGANRGIGRALAEDAMRGGAKRLYAGTRRREFGMQRLIGSTRGQVIRMTGMETILVTVAGIVLGTVISAGLAVSDTLLPSGPIWIYRAIVGTAFALTLPSALVPTWLVARAAAVAAAK